MKIINDKEMLENYIVKFEIREYFDTTNLDFKLIKFEKGSFLTKPLQGMKYMLFIVSGSVKIQNLEESGVIHIVGKSGKFDFLGDCEFATGRNPQFYTLAMSDVFCVALEFSKYNEILHKDVRFLNFIVKKLGNGFRNSAGIEYSYQSVDKKLLYYLKYMEPNHEIDGVEQTVSWMKCSRRQLQRVIAKLCDEGVLIKTGKGKYSLKEVADEDFLKLYHD